MAVNGAAINAGFGVAGVAGGVNGAEYCCVGILMTSSSRLITIIIKGENEKYARKIINKKHIVVSNEMKTGRSKPIRLIAAIIRLFYYCVKRSGAPLG